MFLLSGLLVFRRSDYTLSVKSARQRNGRSERRLRNSSPSASAATPRRASRPAAARSSCEISPVIWSCQGLAEHRAGRDTAPIIAGKTDQHSAQSDENAAARQTVMPIRPYHSASNSTSPSSGKAFSATAWPSRDGRQAGVAQRSDAAEHQPAGTVHPEGRQNFLGIPAPFTPRQYLRQLPRISGRVAKLK